MFKPATASLNMRNEIFASCRHRASKLLAKSQYVLLFFPLFIRFFLFGTETGVMFSNLTLF